MKNILTHFVQVFELEKVNWPVQMSILKRLLKKYKTHEILYAIDYYHRQGIKMYSIGYLLNTMDKPIRELSAVQNIAIQEGSSSDRNQRRVRENNQALNRKKHYFDLFEESDEDIGSPK